MPCMVEVQIIQPSVSALTVIAGGDTREQAIAAAMGWGGPRRVVDETVRPLPGVSPVMVACKEIGEDAGEPHGEAGPGGLPAGPAAEGPSAS